MKAMNGFGRLVSLLTIASILVVAVAGCAAGPTPTPGPTQTPAILKQTVIVPGTPVVQVITATPAKPAEKVLRIARAEPTMGLDPAKAGTAASLRGIELIHDPLVERDKDSKLIPWIAESWSTNADASVWTFLIRDGVKFSDGSPLTADDVKFSFERMAQGDVWKGRLIVIKSIEVKDAKTVIITMTRSLPEFLDMTGATVQYSIVSKKACGDAACDFSKPGTPVSGPWYLKEYTPKSKMVLTRNPNYWLTGYPKFDRVDYLFNEDATAAVAAVESGTADLFGPLAAKDVARLRANPAVSVAYARKIGQATGFGFDKTKPPFNDKRVRQAVGYLLEPMERTQACWFNIGQPLYGGYFYASDTEWFSVLGREPWRKPRADRLTLAAQLLTAAGWRDDDKNGIRESHGVTGIPDNTPLKAVVAYESNWAQAECHTLLLQRWLKDGGLDIQPDRYDPGAYWTDARAGKFNMWHVGITGSDIPWEHLRTFFHSKGDFNSYAARVSDATLDTMIDKMLAETNLQKRTPLMSEIVDYLVDQQYFVAGGSQDTVLVVTSKMINFYIQHNHSARSLVTADIPGR